MKQETEETTVQNSIPEKKSKERIDVLNIGHFYKLFQKEKRRYAISLFSVSKSRTKKELPIKLYKEIVKEYLKIYFYEFYFFDNSVYFPWGGLLKKVSYPKWRFGKSGSDGAIGLFWYLRPSKKMFFMVDILKTTGSTNQIPKIEARFKKNKNQDLLPIFTQERDKCKSNRTLYRNY